jgi:hypothetical protein
MISPKNKSRARNTALSFLVIFSSLALTACGEIVDLVKTAPEVSNLTISLDTSFKGTLESYQNQEVTLNWTAKGNLAYSNKSINEKYTVEMIFAGEKLEKKEIVRIPIKDLDTRSFILDLNSFHPYYTAPFTFMAQSAPDSTFTFKVKVLQEGDDGSAEVKSEVSKKWIRPQVSVPVSPVIGYEWFGPAYSPCVNFTDMAIHSFDAYPSKVASRTFIGEKEYAVRDSSDNLDHILGLTCPEKGGVSLKAIASHSNTAGSSKEVSKTIKSIATGKAPAQIENDSKADKIAGCSNKLKVNELSAVSGDCGYLKIEVLQSDLDTGSCNFLGYWTEAGGARKIGFFEYCSAFRAGSVEEDLTYTLYVRVGGPTSYTSRLGTSRSVLSFTVITDK